MAEEQAVNEEGFTQAEQEHINAVVNAEPEPILGKFKDQAALEQGYIALEKKLGERNVQPEVIVPDPIVQPIVDPNQQLGLGLSPKAGETTADARPLEEYLAEAGASGEMTAENRTAVMAEYNLQEGTLDTLIAQSHTTYRADVASMVAMIGGEEALKALDTFVLSKYNEEEVIEINSMIASDKTRELIIRGLQAEMAGKGTQPVDNTVNASSPDNVGFATPEEYQKAMEDPRYTDRAHPHHQQYLEWFADTVLATPEHLRY